MVNDSQVHSIPANITSLLGQARAHHQGTDMSVLDDGV